MEIMAEVMTMAMCGTCGATLTGNGAYCSSCGMPVMGAARPSGDLVRAPESTDLGSNVAGALAYLLGFISGIIVLKIQPYNQNPFVRFHAFQSIFLNISAILLFIVLGALSIPLEPGFLWSTIALAKFLLTGAVGLLYLFMMYKALRGQLFSLPFIGPMAATRAGYVIPE
jgi:uncharacterized membrane protein